MAPQPLTAIILAENLGKTIVFLQNSCYYVYNDMKKAPTEVRAL